MMTSLPSQESISSAEYAVRFLALVRLSAKPFCLPANIRAGLLPLSNSATVTAVICTFTSCPCKSEADSHFELFGNASLTFIFSLQLRAYRPVKKGHSHLRGTMDSLSAALVVLVVFL